MGFPKEKLKHVTEIVSQWVPAPYSPKTREENEIFTKYLYRISKEEIMDADSRLNHEKGKPASWWTWDCTTAQ